MNIEEKVAKVKSFELTMKGPDADTILADIMCETRWDINELSREVIEIWENSEDKTSVEALFLSLAGIEFEEYLDRCIKELS